MTTEQHGDEADRQPNNFVSTFPYPGNKGRQSDWIIEKLPPHDTYVEVFGGAAGILYNKPPSTNEVYNDINQDLVQFFRILRTREAELVEWLEAVPYARSLYEEWVTAFFNGHRPDDPIERAGRFFVLRYMQFAGDMTGPNGFKTRAKRSPARTFNNARMQLREIADRFNEVVIENKDFGEVLEIYDDQDVDVLFYLDPPYVGAESYYGDGFDHARLADCLQSVESDWMVSYSEVPDELAAVDGVTILNRSRRHRMCRGVSESDEALVCSFDPGERSQFLGDGSEQKRLMTDGGREQHTDEGPREVDFVHTTPAVTLRPVACDEMESRVGEVRLEVFEGDGRDLRIVIALTEKELTVAEYSGLLIEHPLQDKLIMLAPWDHGEHVDDVFGCTTTKYTRPRLESGSLVEYTHEESRNTAFELKEDADA